MASEINVCALPLIPVTIPAGGIHPQWTFTPEQIDTAVKWGAWYAQNRIQIEASGWNKIQYPHHFDNRERKRRVGGPLPPFVLRQLPRHLNKIYTFPIMRKPPGEIFRVGVNNIAKNPDRVLFAVDEPAKVIYLGTITHAGTWEAGFEKNEFFLFD